MPVSVNKLKLIFNDFSQFYLVPSTYFSLTNLLSIKISKYKYNKKKLSINVKILVVILNDGQWIKKKI